MLDQPGMRLNSLILLVFRLNMVENVLRIPEIQYGRHKCKNFYGLAEAGSQNVLRGAT